MSSGKGGLFLCFRQQDTGVGSRSTPRRQGAGKAVKSPPKWHECLAFESESPGKTQSGFSIGSENEQVSAKSNELCHLLDDQDSCVPDCSPKPKREPANRAELLATIKRLRRAAERQEELLATRSRQLYTKQQEVEQMSARLATAEQHSKALHDQLTAATPRKHSSEAPPAPDTPPAGGAASASATPTPSAPTTPLSPPATPLDALQCSLMQLQQLNSQLTRSASVGGSHITPNPLFLNSGDLTPVSTLSSPPPSTPTTPTPDSSIARLVSMLESQLRQHAQLLKSLVPATPPGSGTPHDSLLPPDQDSKPLHPALAACGAQLQGAGGGAAANDKAAATAAAVVATASAALRQRDREVAQLQQVRSDLEEELSLERRRAELLQQQVARLQRERAEKSSAACQVLEEELQEYQSMVDHLEGEHAQQARLLKDMAARYHGAEACVRRLKAEASAALAAEEGLRQEVAHLKAQLAERQQQQQQAPAAAAAASSQVQALPPKPQQDEPQEQQQQQQQQEGEGALLSSPESCASPSKGFLADGVDLEASVVKLVGQKVALEGQLRDSQHEVKLLRTQLAVAVARNREEHRAWLAQTSTSMQQLEAMGAELRASLSNNERKQGAGAAAELRGGVAGASTTPRKAPPPAASSASPWGSSKSLKAPSPTPSPSPGRLTNRQAKSTLSKSTSKLASPFKPHPPWRTNTLTTKQRASTNSLLVSKPAAVWH